MTTIWQGAGRSRAPDDGAQKQLTAQFSIVLELILSNAQVKLRA
jgi:hypothetical protein